MGEDGKPAPPGLVPTLEQSMEQRTCLIGTAEDVAEGIAFYRDLLGCDYLVLFPQFAGEPFRQAEEQLERFWSEVVPLL